MDGCIGMMFVNSLGGVFYKLGELLRRFLIVRLLVGAAPDNVDALIRHFTD